MIYKGHYSGYDPCDALNSKIERLEKRLKKIAKSAEQSKAYWNDPRLTSSWDQIIEIARGHN